MTAHDTVAGSASVLEHRFGSSGPYTLGVEEEYMLLDAQSFELVQHVEAVLASVEGHELESRVGAEMMQSVVEVATPVCRSVAEVDRELRRLRAYVADVAGAHGLRVASAGTHPFSLHERQLITARDRYWAIVDRLQYLARRELIFGLHVHVAVDDPDSAIAVVNGLVAHLSQLLALSANSPFWRGEETGLASTRQLISAAFPRAGPPPQFHDYSEYAAVVDRLVETDCIDDYSHIWWDIRPHPRLGTVEIRICDAVTAVEDAVALAAFCQALVKLYCERHQAGIETPSHHRVLTSENKWLAARYGLAAHVIDLEAGSGGRVPVAQLIRRTLRELEPHARELGCDGELDGVRAILERGNGADRQLQIWRANRDLVEVMREVAAASTADARWRR